MSRSSVAASTPPWADRARPHVRTKDPHATTAPRAPEAPSPPYDQGVLREIARRVRWLSAAIVDAALTLVGR